jgi:8-oxo-dGTP pyrophosphatase MutT (NUDIX family)
MEQEQILPSRPDRRELTAAEIRAAFSQHEAGVRLSETARWGLSGDFRLNPDMKPLDELTRAAVLVGLVGRPEGLTILLTQRTAHLSAHAGQISFPGGRFAPEDADAVACALRESEEEVGLPAEHVEIIGRLDTFITGTGYDITPVVGLIRAPFPVMPQPEEVAEVFEVPLSIVIDPANHQRQSGELRGRTRTFYVISYPGRYIWGATAAMLVNLAEVLNA